MKAFKKTFVSMLALVTACGMLTTAAMAEEAAPAETAATVAVATAEAEAKTEPIEGSWVLYEVYEVKEGAEPVLLKKEENQSLYGSGIGVYTFDADGAAHHNMIEGTDNKDESALWAVNEPNVYAYTEGSINETFRYVEAEGTLHRTMQEESRTLDFVYARAMVGSWKLDKVVEIHEGDAPVDLPKEENQSLYGAGESILTFKTDGKTSEEITDGADKSVVEGTWKLTATDSFTYTQDTLEMAFQYFRADDTIFRDVKDEAPDAAHPHLRFTYVRVIPAPEVKEEETAKAAQAETKAAAPAPAPASSQKRNGFSMDLVAAEGGDAITIYQLEDNSYVDDYGITYTQEGGGGDHWYGSDGKVWVTPDAYANEGNADGQNFTGFSMNLVAEGGGDATTIYELTDFSYVDSEGMVFTQEGGGGDHWYGSDGSVWIVAGAAEDSADDADDSYADDTTDDTDDSDDYSDDEE